MSRRVSFIGLACTVGLVLAASGCIVTSSPREPPPDTEVGIDPTLSFRSPTGSGCGAGLSTYTVALAGESPQTYNCDQPAVFQGLQPNTQYTFDIQGYASNGSICWSGACTTPPTDYGLLDDADCSAALPYTCH
jgi:hypothetical protein